MYAVRHASNPVEMLYNDEWQKAAKQQTFCSVHYKRRQTVSLLTRESFVIETETLFHDSRPTVSQRRHFQYISQSQQQQ